MMIGETRRHHQIDVPPWQESYNPISTTQITSSASPPMQSSNGGGLSHLPNSPTYYDAVLASLRRYLMSDGTADNEPPSPVAAADYSGEVDFLSGDYDDDFFMYDFKIRKCTRARAHDWTECPFAHPGEKARRRDPRKYSYSGTACSEFRKGGCKKGDCCEFAHGVFECWLHPNRFRTQACKDGPGCKRRVCFFAHTPDQLRAGSGLSSPRSGGLLSGYEDGAMNSPNTVGDIVASLRNLQLNKVKSMPTSWGSHPIHGSSSPVFGSPRGVGAATAMSRAGFFSLPTTPTRPRVGYWDAHDFGPEEEAPVMERVESGRELRARMFEKLSKENPLDGSGSPLSASAPAPGPDFGWVCDLIE
ncbi:hypothetical protein SOVF_072110 [Spinacia oleracea]|uniref:Zinc finger CCCH domain-containing protein 20 n=1 Tax=Spinacia oleracea TaxID=3562 RepID=A0A9R0JZ76_SPIOL|nr:zinc finger CCCH domain-containing protein 20-like [Spinacia oleracea]KNA18312.1 hypothetical protein SOVF_072110 [Spinacia oleracea]